MVLLHKKNQSFTREEPPPLFTHTTFTMKFDVNILRYIEKDTFRTLVAVEMGMKNHEIVPVQLINAIAGLKKGGGYKHIRELLKHKLVHHDNSKYDGYRLTPLGYDFLAIKAFTMRNRISGVGRRIGVGKESDVYEVVNDEGRHMAMKLHRLGRTSFKAVKNKRDYLHRRTSFNWLYLSRLSALKEHAFMQALHERDFNVPEAIDLNRHCVLMEMVDGFPLTQVKKMMSPGKVYNSCMQELKKLALCGLIHCDYNEFNIMMHLETLKVTVIDFPQMVSIHHRNARMLFDRDVECLHKFFLRRYGYDAELDVMGEPDPDFDEILKEVAEKEKNGEKSVDSLLKASGFTSEHQKMIDEVMAEREERAKERALHRNSDGEYSSEEGFDDEDDEYESDEDEESSGGVENIVSEPDELEEEDEEEEEDEFHDEELNLNPDEVSALASQVEAMLNDPNAVVPKYDDEVGPLIREAGKKRDKLAKDGRPVQPAPSAMTASSIRSRADLGNNPELIRAKLKAEKAKKTFKGANHVQTRNFTKDKSGRRGVRGQKQKVEVDPFWG